MRSSNLNPLLKKLVLLVVMSLTVSQITSGTITAEQNSTKHIAMVSSGPYHNLALKDEGTVWSWGNNSSGELGDGTTAMKKVPVKVEDLTDIIYVAAGNISSSALKNDGTVWCWGNNAYGQIGDGTLDGRSKPVMVKNLTGVKSVAAGRVHMMALKEDGTVWCWGNNAYGQLGIGNSESKNIPVKVPGLTNVIYVAAGGDHSFAVKDDGTVWAWGLNNSGELGEEIEKGVNSPVQIKGLKDVKSIVSCPSYTLALKNDGTVWSWGSNTYGQLGDGTFDSSKAPKKIITLSNITSISAKEENVLALKSDGSVWKWGRMRITDVDAYVSATPEKVDSLSQIEYISAGSRHTVAIKNDGTVWSFGSNLNKQLGNGDAPSKNPLRVSELNLYQKTIVPKSLTADKKIKNWISAGGNHTAVLKNGGEVWCWGLNGSGQLGNGTTQPSQNPIRVKDLFDVASISAGGAHTVALKSNGIVWTWGNNEFGELGIGSKGDGRVETIDSYKAEPQLLNSIDNVSAVSAGNGFTLALKSDGTVWTWGNDSYEYSSGKLKRDRSVPNIIIELSDVTAISTGLSHSIALKKDGTVWVWGNNKYGQLGDGTSLNSNVPKKVDGLKDVKQISAGGNHTVILKTDGTVWAWGDNYYGQVGDGTRGFYGFDSDKQNTVKLKPIQVAGSINEISAGYTHTIALRFDNKVLIWGQLGQNFAEYLVKYNKNPDDTKLINYSTSNIGTTYPSGYKYDAYYRKSPYVINEFLSNIKDIDAGNTFSVALNKDGTLWFFGNESNLRNGGAKPAMLGQIPDINLFE